MVAPGGDQPRARTARSDLSADALHTGRLPAPTAQCSAGYHHPRPAGEVDAPRDEWEGRHRGEDVRHLHHHRAAGVAVRIPRYLDVDRYPDSLTLDEGSDVRLGRAAAARGTAYRVRLDRKSTRLNSSHVKISYAVFCLKKKMIGK